MESAAGLPWNQRQLSPGIGGRLAMESVAAFVWNGWQLCRGISGRIHLESVAALPWNTQSIHLLPCGVSRAIACGGWKCPCLPPTSHMRAHSVEDSPLKGHQGSTVCLHQHAGENDFVYRERNLERFL